MEEEMMMEGGGITMEGGGQMAQAAGIDPSLIVLIIGLFFIYLVLATSLYFLARKLDFEADSWHAFVPVLNCLLLLKMCKKPVWWVALMPVLPPILLLDGFFHLSNAGENKAMLFVSIGLLLYGLIGYAISFLLGIKLAELRGMKKGWGVAFALLPMVGYPIVAFSEPLQAA